MLTYVENDHPITACSVPSLSQKTDLSFFKADLILKRTLVKPQYHSSPIAIGFKAVAVLHL